MTRMWMIDPRILCHNEGKKGGHLNGEYYEIAKAVGNVRKKRSLDGWLENNCLEPLSFRSRFDVLKAEMIRRGFNAKAVLKPYDLNYLGDKKYIRINRKASFKELMKRCDRCKKRYRRMVS